MSAVEWYFLFASINEDSDSLFLVLHLLCSVFIIVCLSVCLLLSDCLFLSVCICLLVCVSSWLYMFFSSAFIYVARVDCKINDLIR